VRALRGPGLRPVRERTARFVVIGAVALAFATALGAAFQFDDFHLVARNADVHSWAAWAASMPGIRPLTKASLTLSWTLAGKPAGFVAFSVLCHAAGALLLLELARRWLPELAPACPRAAFAALATALVFALHPAQTEAVTYVAGRSVVLSGVLYLAALLAFERARTATSLALFALALAARETAWTLPFALVLLETARGHALRPALRGAAPHFGLLGAAIVAMAAMPAYRWLLQASLAHRSPGESVFAQVEGIAYLVTHPLLTLRVNFDPDVAVPSAPDLHWWIAATAIAAAMGVGFAALRRHPWLGFGILWFFLQLAPTNGPIARYDLANDRELYLALAGPALIAGVALGSIRRRLAGTIAALALVAALGVSTGLRNLDYASEIALWQATVQASPGKARAWNNLGYAWQQAGDADRARAAYVRALLQDPGYARARINLDALSAPQEAVGVD